MQKLKKRKGFTTILLVLTLVAMIAFLAGVVDVGMILSTRNAIKNNLELAGLAACTNDLDLGYLRNTGKYRLKYTDEDGITINPFNQGSFPSESTNPAEHDVADFFYHSSKGIAGLMDTQHAQLTIWIYPQGIDYPPDWQGSNSGGGVVSRKNKAHLLAIDPIVPNKHYAMVFMEAHVTIYPIFLPAVGIGKNGISMTIRVATETKPQTQLSY